MNRWSEVKTLSIFGCGGGFCRHAPSLGLEIAEGDADIAVVGEHPEGKLDLKTEILFIPDGKVIKKGTILCVSALSAGMGPKATLGFSSFRRDAGTLAVNRGVDFFGVMIEPCEIHVETVKTLSVYENMVFGFLKHFL